MNPSMIEQFGPNVGNRCGYCKTSDHNHSYGMFAHTLTVDDYQDLIDRGWRRSGIYCYKPTMNQTCCPAYTIKCSTLEFSLTKSQKKILKKFNKYLSEGQISDSNIKDEKNISEEKSRSSTATPSCKDDNKSMEQCKPSISKGVGADPNRGPCKKAKQLRLERKEAKLKIKGINPTKSSTSTPQNIEKSLEDIINELPEAAKKKLKTKLVRTTSNSSEWKATETAEHNLYLQYQVVVHDDPPNKCTKKQFENFLVHSPLKIKTVKNTSDEFDLTFKTTFKLYSAYQINIHKDSPEECNEKEFYNFLVETPLQAETRGSVEYGSFHQQYWIDDKLIAVGVIDILPKCISSVYFFYDPSYNELSLGNYGALREIGFTREMQKICPDIKYYYMGFYIHSCVKMRYKGNYLPSYLLCPETYEWFPIKDCLGKLDKNPYSRLNPDQNAPETNCFEESDMNKIILLNVRNSQCMNYTTYKELCRKRFYMVDRIEQENIMLFGKLVGKKSSSKILILV